MGMVIMGSQNRKGALYQIVAFILAKHAVSVLVKFTALVLAKLATLVFRRPESGLRYNFEMDLFG
ncbi:hypothetical protein NEIFLAOT_01928 [Neisseria flavescens NRL30031/H210]|uniref:Uncharacterized protein n=1 Tax=Neisseria flavescens NRL30031/H210 TaxID=546264 RepID=C0EPN9_NEIFL|nr:hypothetical protein NEIFLAOT_01928 [Neisseria flavescens NRL30031/H210]